MNPSRIFTDMKGPIGVFDSGYGGLTILKELREVLPEHDFLYLGDNARAPYGARSFEVVYEFTLEAVQELFDRGCELVILACNTASAKALRTIQQKDLPRIAPDRRVLGVIRPSTELIGALSQSHKVGVLATEGTVRSNSYAIEIAKFSPETQVYQRACPMWVPLIENGRHTSEAGRSFIREDVEALLDMDAAIDVIILGCTHYPIVKSVIEEFVPKHIQVVAQGSIVADRLKDYLERHPEMEARCSRSGTVRYLTTESVESFNQNASNFIGQEITAVHIRLGEARKTGE